LRRAIIGGVIGYAIEDEVCHRPPDPYLGATSEERARLIGDHVWRNPAMADLLVDLEADEDLSARVEIELLRALGDSGQR
jgi:hypothetical protein